LLTGKHTCFETPVQERSWPGKRKKSRMQGGRKDSGKEEKMV
jgi:hypothetical protein